MNFKQLLEHLEECLGYHQVPVNPSATGARDVFECSPLHHELMTELIKAIYLENNCRHLTDPVKRKPTFKAMTPIRLKVLRSLRTDVDAFQLIDALCTAVDQAFSKQGGQENGEKRQSKHATDESPKADVIQLDNFRYRRFNQSRLAPHRDKS
ncbi:MAG: hypothetical protein OES46_09035 [Gammaproteobacteria bacterium]|jgi:hypothetical protein|nr:hypothetical protein [Gammaproteobacteria bacterium]